MKRVLSLLGVCLSLLLLASMPFSQLTSAQRGASDRLARTKLRSYDFLQTKTVEYGLASIDELTTKRVEVDEVGMGHTRVQQTYQGVPVFGAEAIVHLNKDDSLFAFTDHLLKDITVDIRPALAITDAINTALAHYGCSDCLTSLPQVDLWILRQQDGDHLTYRVQLWREDGSEQTAMPVYFIDAHSGALLWNYDNLQTATGSSLYSGSVTINTYFKSPTYYMEDITRKIGTFDFRNGTSSVYRFTDTNNVWDSSSQRAGVDAHYGAAKVYDYYKNTHGRTGIDGNGGPGGYTSANGTTRLISSRVHYGSNYNNAFWNGTYMTYGDGNGSTFSPLVTLDICGHEMAHGVTERTAGLVYSGESGALNESWSDVFGAMVERSAQGQTGNTWKIGEQCYTPGNGTGDALRYMDNPHAASNSGYTADDDPDHYSERYTGTGDNGGVHINSGIANKAFYLLSVGGSHHRGGSMTGIGADKAARIWYRALTSYMTSSTNFRGARTATLNAANALYGSGSTESNAVASAWTLCGVN